MTTASLRLRAAAVQPYNAFCRGTWRQQLGGRSRRVNLVVHFCTNRASLCSGTAEMARANRPGSDTCSLLQAQAAIAHQSAT